MREPPVDPEIIRQRIYDAGKSLGRNDPFLASELTDSVMHFVEQDFDESIVSPQDLLATVTKVISELGHPQLAIAVENDWADTSNTAAIVDLAIRDASKPPAGRNQVVHSQMCQYSLAHVYPSSIVAAHELGLIELQDLDLPFELAGGVVELARRSSLSEPGIMHAIAHARHRFGRFVELQLPEIVPQSQHPAEWCATLSDCLDLAQLRAFVHLPKFTPGAFEDASLFADIDLTPPTAKADVAQLFPDERRASTPNAARLAFVRALIQAGSNRIRPVIAFGVADVDDLSFVELLHILVVNRVPVIFTYGRGDEPRWRVTGGSVRCPAELVAVRVNLPALLTTSAPGGHASSLFDRLGGLVRLAHAAGRAKQAFLRRNGHPSQREGFLLERSAVVIEPVGIAEFALNLNDTERAQGDAESRIVQELHSAARQCSAHGPPCLLRLKPDEMANGRPTVPNYYESVFVPTSSSMLGSGQSLLELLLRLYRESKVSAVWINGEDCS